MAFALQQVKCVGGRPGPERALIRLLSIIGETGLSRLLK